jgi:hypothetical protein
VDESNKPGNLISWLLKLWKLLKTLLKLLHFANDGAVALRVARLQVVVCRLLEIFHRAGQIA